MLKKVFKFTDYNGMERTETHYFNLTKSELMKKEMSINGGLTEMIKRVSETLDAPVIMEIFEDLILSAYGKKSDDGRRFIKSKELSEEFKQTEAYDQLFMELITDSKAAADFFKGIVPEDAAEQIDKANHPALQN